MQNVVEMGEWAQRTGRIRIAFGPNSALVHYLGKLPVEDFAIFHSQFSPAPTFNIRALKALSRRLCTSTVVAASSNFVILVKKQLALSTFGSGFRGRVLTHTAIDKSVGSSHPKDIASRILSGELPLAKKHHTSIVRRLLQQK